MQWEIKVASSMRMTIKQQLRNRGCKISKERSFRNVNDKYYIITLYDNNQLNFSDFEKIGCLETHCLQPTFY